MALFEQFPYTNFHNLNLDWLLKQVKSQGERLADVESAITDIQTNFIAPWNSTKAFSTTDADGGGLITPDEKIEIRSVEYRLTGRVLEYYIYFNPKAEYEHEEIGTIEMDMPAWIKAHPYSATMYKNDPEVYEHPLYQGQVIWRHRDNGTLFLRKANVEYHTYTVYGFMVLEDLDDVPTE